MYSSSPIDCEEDLGTPLEREFVTITHRKSLACLRLFNSLQTLNRQSCHYRTGLMLSRLRDLGFGKHPSIDFPGSHLASCAQLLRIKPIEMITTAYGHGMSASMVQTLAFAVLGNDGLLMRPRLIKEVLTPEGYLTIMSPKILGRSFNKKRPDPQSTCSRRS